MSDRSSVMIGLDGLIELFGDLADGGGTDGFAQNREQGLAYLTGRETEKKGQ